YLHLAEEAEIRRRGPEMTLWLNRLEMEHDNLRAALDSHQAAASSPSIPEAREKAAEAGLRMVAVLMWFWQMRGYFAGSLERLKAALALAEGLGPTSYRAKALNGASLVAMRQGDYAAARAFCEESLEISRGLGDRCNIAIRLSNLG